MSLKLYNKIINNIAKSIKQTINESVFDEDDIAFINDNNDDNIFTEQVKQETFQLILLTKYTFCIKYFFLLFFTDKLHKNIIQ